MPEGRLQAGEGEDRWQTWLEEEVDGGRPGLPGSVSAVQDCQMTETPELVGGSTAAWEMANPEEKKCERNSGMTSRLRRADR